MEVTAAKMIGVGLCMIPLAGVGSGLGALFAAIVNVIGRNPSVANDVKNIGWIYFALVEAIAIYALGIALLMHYTW
jgi:F-type H+-transporting ATPase subunit c